MKPVLRGLNDYLYCFGVPYYEYIKMASKPYSIRLLQVSKEGF